MQILDVKGVEYCDRRSSGPNGNGNLWVFGAENFPGLIESFEDCGAQFTYRDNAGKQFGYRSTWWLRGYPELKSTNADRFSAKQQASPFENEVPIDKVLRELAIIELFQQGWSQEDVAKAFGLTLEAVAKIIESYPDVATSPTTSESAPQAEATGIVESAEEATDVPTGAEAKEERPIDKVFGIRFERNGESGISKAFLSYEAAFNAVDAAMEAVKLFGFDDPRPDITEIEIVS